MFLAATLLLNEDQILHFHDIPYLHQHLVANLPAEPPDDLPATSPAIRSASSSKDPSQGRQHAPAATVSEFKYSAEEKGATARVGVSASGATGQSYAGADTNAG